MSTYDEKPDKPLNELLTSTLVQIYVGPDNTRWNLHERLLCYYSPYFRKIFYSPETEASHTKAYGFPDTDDHPFELFVGWLYSRTIRYPASEKEIGPLLDLYLLSETLEIAKLSSEVVDAVRAFYHNEESYPGLRRVQYIYANTGEDNEMREMMVGAVARYLTLSDTIPKHWDNALKRNGQLGVDIIRSIQQWHLEDRSVPDVRDLSMERGRKTVGFSAVEEGTSLAESERDVKQEHEEGETEGEGGVKGENGINGSGH